jgi:3-demethoxyubiquinol 3-hydroxylase
VSGVRRLPGDPPADEIVRRMIRVDHAGEMGAARIYRGQLAVLGRTTAAPVIRRMEEQEKRHLAAFDKLIVDRRVRPTLLSPLWHVAGWALGAASAALGERAAMACTAAVEEVIDAHYAAQIETLGGAEPELAQSLEEFRRNEIEHRDVALAEGAEEAPAYAILSTAIKAGSKLAIWLSTRL